MNLFGGPGGNRTLISWMQARDPPVERRAHPGEDNGTRTRTPALTTRRLSLRLCPPQDGPSDGMVGSRGFEPRSARSERAASANCATSRVVGPSGWIRTITSRVKSPACCVDTTEGMERMTGFEPVPQGLEGPWATVTPHSLWHRRRQFSKTPLFRASPYCPSGDSARSRTRTHELWRLGCSRYTTLPTSSHVSTVAKTHPSSEPGPCLSTGRGQNKKGLLGDRPRRPGFSMSADPLGRFALLAAIDRAAVAIDPRLSGGYRHADHGS